MDLLLSCCTAAAPAAALAAAPANTFTWSHHIITIIWPYGRMMAWSHKYNHMINFKSFPGSPTPTLYRSPVRKSSSVGIGLPKDCPLQPKSIHWSGWMLDKIVRCKFSKNLQIKRISSPKYLWNFVRRSQNCHRTIFGLGAPTKKNWIGPNVCWKNKLFVIASEHVQTSSSVSVVLKPVNLKILPAGTNYLKIYPRKWIQIQIRTDGPNFNLQFKSLASPLRRRPWKWRSADPLSGRACENLNKYCFLNGPQSRSYPTPRSSKLPGPVLLS